jgi:malonyl-CoA O-methyltransferase
MLRGVFVTGTDTGVGKTVASAALLHRYRAGARLRYWKPVQTGIEQDDDTAAVRCLGACCPEEIFAEGVRLRNPVSPHLAAQWAGVAISVRDVLAMLPRDFADSRWVVEGAGGALVPLSEREFMIDLMHALALPVVVVSRSTLGTINHTLLTLEALRTRSLRIAGVLMVGQKNSDNRAAIERYGAVPVLGEMPPLPSIDAAALAGWTRAELDLEGRLMEFLG